VATLRRRACDAGIIPIVLGGDGRVLDLGARRRLASLDQHRALRAMYRSCAWPGCTVQFDRCDMHHVREFRHHRRTDLADLLPLCNCHHHAIHDGGWRLVLDPDRTVRLYAPDGSLAAVQPFTGLVAR
jgi:hypothetical protein